MDAPNLQRLFTTVYSGAATLPMPAVLQGAENATYEATFKGPLITCKGLNASEEKVMTSIVNATSWEFASAASLGGVQYLLFQPSPMFLDQDGAPNKTFNYTKFTSECIGSDTSDGDYSDCEGQVDDVHGYFWLFNGGKSSICDKWNATFHGVFSLDSQETQSIIIKENETILEPLQSAAVNEDPYAYTYSRMTYDSMFGTVLQLLRGGIILTESPPVSQDDGAELSVNTWGTSIEKTALIGALDFDYALSQMSDLPYDTATPFTSPLDQALTRNRTLNVLIQELSQNLTLSFFSQSQYWTSPEQSYDTTIRTPRSVNIYNYNARNLLLAYGIALLVSLFAVACGALALWSNGVAHSTSFSAILRTTRNSSLDDLIHGEDIQCLGESPLNKSLGKVELRLGILENTPQLSHDHVTFGLPKEIVPLRRSSRQK